MGKRIDYKKLVFIKPNKIKVFIPIDLFLKISYNINIIN